MNDPLDNNSTGMLSRLGQWFKTSPSSASAPTVQLGRAPEAVALLNDDDIRERAKRKARVDLIRKSEFADLRAMLHQVVASVAPSVHASTRSHTIAGDHQNRREETREKINSIEEQMSRSWYMSSLHSGASKSSSYLSSASRGKVPGDARTGSASQRVMQVIEADSVIDFVYPADAVNASVAFAIGDYISAEKILTTACESKDTLDRLRSSWDLRFELFLSLGKQKEFEDISIDFAAKFGHLPPVWQKRWHVVPGSTASSAESEAPSGQPASVTHYKFGTLVDSEEIQRLLRWIQKTQGSGVIGLDWKAVRRVRTEAVIPLQAVFSHLIKWTGRLESLGSEVLVAVLQQNANDARAPQDKKLRWQLLLAYLNLTGDNPVFENISIDYCVALEESAPPWRPAQCSFSTTAGTIASAEPSNETPEFEPTRLSEQEHDATEPHPAGHVRVDNLRNRLHLSGNLGADLLAPFKQLTTPATKDRALIVECEELVRLDSQAAGQLLYALREREKAGSPVMLHRIHRLIGIYLFSLGLPSNVKMSIVSL